MDIAVEVSLGELIDKISILMIKQINVTDQKKLKNINDEYSSLCDTLNSLDVQESDFYIQRLFVVNNKIWITEDRIRILEKNKSFNEEFIYLARSVYHNNDQRFQIKQEINNKFKSRFREEKQYTSSIINEN